MAQRVSGCTRDVVDCLPGVADVGLTTCGIPFLRIFQGRSFIGVSDLNTGLLLGLGAGPNRGTWIS